MKLTAELIHAASSHPRGDGFTKAQLAVLGIPYPPKKGWLSALVGKEVDDATFERFKAIGNERRVQKHQAIPEPIQFPASADPEIDAAVDAAISDILPSFREALKKRLRESLEVF